MKVNKEITGITLYAEDFKDIRAAFERLIVMTDLQRVIKAMTIITPHHNTPLTPDVVKVKLEEAYVDIIECFGPFSEHGGLYLEKKYWHPSVSVLGLVLSLHLDDDVEGWHWTLDLDLTTVPVYNDKEEG